MKALILDIDGVMATMRQFHMKLNKFGFYPFDEKCVAVLNSIIRETNCEIIISSDWRNTLRLPEMIEIFEMNGVIKTPIGYTPNSKLYKGKELDVGRATEVMRWVELHGVEHWVTVDDLDLDLSGYDALLPETHFIKTPNANEGIKQTGIKEKIITAFGRKYRPEFSSIVHLED